MTVYVRLSEYELSSCDMEQMLRDPMQESVPYDVHTVEIQISL